VVPGACPQGRPSVFVFDTPEHILDQKARKEIVKYCVLQLKELISFLEKVTKRKFDYDRLKEVMKYSAASSILYKKFLDMAQYKPSPISIFDALIGMAIAVYRRGTQECVDYYQTLCNEIQAKVDQGIGVLPKDQEKYRLYWENLPVWFKFSDHAKLLGSYGGVILTSLYVHAWSFEFDLNKDPLETLAENYVNRFSNSTIEDRADMAMDLFKKYSMNGMIMFMNRSCKAVSFAVPTLKEVLRRERASLPSSSRATWATSASTRNPRSAPGSRHTSRPSTGWASRRRPRRPENLQIDQPAPDDTSSGVFSYSPKNCLTELNLI
jgi:benzoyl-CoA reductase/2-hydroxyglutaryl-CoA dehydratase subunit BcrC/BadD/HgdB